MHTSFGESLQGGAAAGARWRRFGLAARAGGDLLGAPVGDPVRTVIPGRGAGPSERFIADVFLSGNYPASRRRLSVAWAGLRGIVFVDFARSRFRCCLIATATFTRRWRRVFSPSSRNIPAMLVWAGLIVVLTAIGFATLLFGMIVIFPILGHATWHAYRDLTQWE